MYLGVSGFIFGGVEALYRSDWGWALIDWQCDEKLKQGELEFGDRVHIGKNDMLKITVWAKDACPTGSGPIPQITPYFPIPTPPPDPTRAPLKSPHPVHVVKNESHFILFSWEDIQEVHQVFNSEVEFFKREELVGSVTMGWSSWRERECPSDEFTCRHADRANLWICRWEWNGTSMETVCFPAADKKLNHTRMHLVPNDQLDASTEGVRLVYWGNYGVRTEINVKCDLSAVDYDIPLGDGLLRYDDHTQPPEFRFEDIRSAYVCPRPFTESAAPTNKRPDPPSGYQAESSFEWDLGDDTIFVDLKALQASSKTVLVGRGHTYGNDQIFFSPWERTTCPTGKHCGVFANDRANIWRCVNRQMDCYPIGDLAYHLAWNASSETEIYGGVYASYSGGADNSSTHVRFFCRENLSEEAVELDEFANEFVYGHTVFLNAHILAACPGGVTPYGQRNKVTGGAIFLLVVMLLAFGYFGIGSFVIFLFGGKADVPFSDFLNEVWLSVKAAIYFLVTCGKSGEAAAATGPYDKI
jgi:hypothetical protein